MKIPKNLNDLAVEVCKREKSDKREVNITETKRVIRHLSDIFAEEWNLNFSFKITSAMRAAGQKRLKRKNK